MAIGTMVHPDPSITSHYSIPKPARVIPAGPCIPYMRPACGNTHRYVSWVSWPMEDGISPLSLVSDRSLQPARTAISASSMGPCQYSYSTHEPAQVTPAGPCLPQPHSTAIISGYIACHMHAICILRHWSTSPMPDTDHGMAPAAVSIAMLSQHALGGHEQCPAPSVL